MNNPIYQKAIQKAEAYCARSEKCISEVQKKLYDWHFPEEYHELVIAHLLSLKFIDEERYAKAFVRDKFRFNKWGKLKIRAALARKRISSENSFNALEEITNNEYAEMLNDVLSQKFKEIKRKESDFYKQKQKVLAFAQSRGFEPDLAINFIENNIN